MWKHNKPVQNQISVINTCNCFILDVKVYRRLHFTTYPIMSFGFSFGWISAWLYYLDLPYWSWVMGIANNKKYYGNQDYSGSSICISFFPLLNELRKSKTDFWNKWLFKAILIQWFSFRSQALTDLPAGQICSLFVWPDGVVRLMKRKGRRIYHRDCMWSVTHQTFYCLAIGF